MILSLAPLTKTSLTQRNGLVQAGAGPVLWQLIVLATEQGWYHFVL